MFLVRRRKLKLGTTVPEQRHPLQRARAAGWVAIQVRREDQADQRSSEYEKRARPTRSSPLRSARAESHARRRDSVGEAGESRDREPRHQGAETQPERDHTPITQTTGASTLQIALAGRQR